MGAETPRLTRAGRISLLVFAGALFSAIIGKALAAFVAAVVVGAMLVASPLLGWLNLRQVRVSRELPDEIFANAPAMGHLLIQNTRRFGTVLGLTVEDEHGAFCHVAALSANKPVRRAVCWRFHRRGPATLHPLTIRSAFPFGLIELRRRVTAPGEVVVYPHLAPAESDRRHAAPLAGDELVDLREYAAGDPLRWVHWPTSARVGRPVVVVRNERVERQILIEVPQAQGEDWEHALSAAAGAVDVWSRRGVAVGMRLDAQRWPPKASTRWRRLLLEQLALAEERT